MKFNYLACALVAALAYAQPIEELIIEEPAGLGEIEPQLATNLTRREPLALEKRSNVVFQLWPNSSKFLEASSPGVPD